MRSEGIREEHPSRTFTTHAHANTEERGGRELDRVHQFDARGGRGTPIENPQDSSNGSATGCNEFAANEGDASGSKMLAR